MPCNILLPRPICTSKVILESHNIRLIAKPNRNNSQQVLEYCPVLLVIHDLYLCLHSSGHTVSHLMSRLLIYSHLVVIQLLGSTVWGSVLKEPAVSINDFSFSITGHV